MRRSMNRLTLQLQQALGRNPPLYYSLSTSVCALPAQIRLQGSRMRYLWLSIMHDLVTVSLHRR
jgi:hypothetical protein